MPENPTDGDSRQAEFAQDAPTYSTRTKSKGSLGAGGQRVLDWDQDQWIMGRRRQKTIDPDQDQWITGRTGSADASSTRTKSNGSAGSTQAEKEKGGARGRTVGIQNRYAPPASKDAAGRASLPLRHGINT